MLQTKCHMIQQNAITELATSLTSFGNGKGIELLRYKSKFYFLNSIEITFECFPFILHSAFFFHTINNKCFQITPRELFFIIIFQPCDNCKDNIMLLKFIIKSNILFFYPSSSLLCLKLTLAILFSFCTRNQVKLKFHFKTK